MTAREDAGHPVVVAAVLAAGILAAAQIGKVPPLLPAIQGELDLTLVEAGWMISLMTMTGAVFGATFGFVADRAGAARTLLSGLALLAAAGLAGSWAQSGAALAVTRALESVGLVAIVVAGPRLLFAAAPPRLHGLTLGAWGCYMPAGMALMMFAAPLLREHGWRGVWQINAGLLLALLVAALLVTRPFWRPAPAAAGSARHGFAAVLALPAPWLLGACFALYSLQWFAVAGWLATYLTGSLRVSPDLAALCTAAVVAVNILGNLTGAWLIHRGIGRAWLVGFAYLAMALAGLVIFAEPGGAAVPILAAGTFSALGGVLPAAVLAGAAKHAPSPSHVGLVSGIIVQGANIGSLAGPPATALAIHLLGGWDRMSWMFLTLNAAGLLLTVALARLEYRQSRHNETAHSPN